MAKKQINYSDLSNKELELLKNKYIDLKVKSMNFDDLKEFYSALGDHLKQNYSGWKVGFLTAMDSPHKFIGLKPSRKIPIKNGSIECRLFIYELYRGSRKASKYRR